MCYLVQDYSFKCNEFCRIYSIIKANIKGVLIWLMIWDHECKHDWGFQNEAFLYTDVQRVFFLKSVCCLSKTHPFQLE